jgi:glycosyltransferase involved in cell wall biosynthesis
MNPVVRILIIGQFGYPFGSASANHMRLFAKGLRLAGAEVRVLSQSRLIRRECDRQPDGTLAYENTPYETSAGYEYTSRPSSLKRAARYTQAIWTSIRRFQELIKGGEIDSVILYNHNFIASQPIVSLCRRYRVPVFPYVVEWFLPAAYRGGIVNPLYWNDLAQRIWTNKQCTGVLVISSFADRWYSKRGLRSLRVQVLFDFENIPNREQTSQSSGTREFNLTYAGYFKRTDGTLDMLDAVKIARRNGCPVRLTIVGSDGTTGTARRVYECSQVDDFLRGHITFLGRVLDEEYMTTLSEADALILIRSAGIMSEASFPMRLPEYLATGRPVITTAVPDVPDYLTDGVHAHVVPPGRPDLIAERLVRLWRDPVEGRLLGQAGRARARECFDYRLHTQRLFKFITETVASSDF